MSHEPGADLQMGSGEASGDLEKAPAVGLRRLLERSDPEEDVWSAVVYVIGRRQLRSFRQLLVGFALDESLSSSARATAADSWARLLRAGDGTEPSVVAAVETLRYADDQALRDFALSAATKIDLPGVDEWAEEICASSSSSGGERHIAGWWLREGRATARARTAAAVDDGRVGADETRSSAG